jgi:hypothetical protein
MYIYLLNLSVIQPIGVHLGVGPTHIHHGGVGRQGCYIILLLLNNKSSYNILE